MSEEKQQQPEQKKDVQTLIKEREEQSKKDIAIAQLIEKSGESLSREQAEAKLKQQQQKQPEAGK